MEDFSPSPNRETWKLSITDFHTLFSTRPPVQRVLVFAVVSRPRLLGDTRGVGPDDGSVQGAVW